VGIFAEKRGYGKTLTKKRMELQTLRIWSENYPWPLDRESDLFDAVMSGPLEGLFLVS
jgi:hypothetical protein